MKIRVQGFEVRVQDLKFRGQGLGITDAVVGEIAVVVQASHARIAHRAVLRMFRTFTILHDSKFTNLHNFAPGFCESKSWGEIINSHDSLPRLCCTSCPPRSAASVTNSLCKSRFPHKSFNLSFIITDVQNKLTDVGRS